MVNKSRSDIYDYLYKLFHGTVTENVYMIGEPQELESTDRADGFLVILLMIVNLTTTLTDGFVALLRHTYHPFREVAWTLISTGLLKMQSIFQ